MRQLSSSPPTSSSPAPAERSAEKRPGDLSLLWMFLAGALAMALAAAARGQAPTAEPPAGRFADEIRVTEVLLDALVTDRDGNVILGLGPGDFRITDEGRPVTVTGVTFYSNRRYLESAGAARLGIDPAAVPDRRLLVLFFDDQRRNDHDLPGLTRRQLQAARDAEAWIATGLEPGDLVAVASFDAKLKLHADFTADRARLTAAVRSAARGGDGLADWPSRRPTPSAEPSLAAGLPAGTELRDRTPRIYDALTLLADAAAAIPGRKNLLLYSIGFGDLDGFGHYVRDHRFYPRMEQALNAANVAVYSIDLTPAGTRHPFEDALDDVALGTGGRFFHDLMGFELPLERVARETNGYYLVAFPAQHPAGATGYREVRVEAVNPEFRIQARGGYRLGG